MKYKVGDKVLIRKGLSQLKDPWGTSPEKLSMAGTVQVVGLVEDSVYLGIKYYTMKSSPWWCFTDEMIERKVDMFTKDDLKDGDVLYWSDGRVSLYRGAMFDTAKGRHIISVKRDGEEIYKKPPRKMTVKEICNALGYEVEIVKD
jgi:hypothetical protein